VPVPSSFRSYASGDITKEITRNEKLDSIIVIIDAIDECDDKTQRLIMSRTIRMITSDGVPSVKFFITSRRPTFNCGSKNVR
jgi:hypothetical protein